MRVSRQTLKDEGGAVLLIVAAALAAIILIAAFVVDVANWFEHKRHLQMQADAAALAGAADFRIPCDNPPIVSATTDYSGSKYNAQIGGTPAGNVHMLINSRTYYNQPSKVDDTVNTGQPCDARMVDV